jgi:DNA polymerase-3 subunit alpha
MDSLGRRAQLMAALDKAMEQAQKAQRDAESGQHGLFGVFQQEDAEAHNDKLPNSPDWDEHTRLSAEKEILGFFISGHPLEKYKDKLGDLQALSVEEIAAMTRSTAKEETINTAGIITNVRVLKSKRGDFYAQAMLEDMSGTIDMIVFPEAYKRIGDPKITAAEIQPLEEAKVPLPSAIRIRIRLDSSNESTVDALHTLFIERKGPAQVLFDMERENDFMVVMEAQGYNVVPDRNFIARVEELCGRGSVRRIGV